MSIVVGLEPDDPNAAHPAWAALQATVPGMSPQVMVTGNGKITEVWIRDTSGRRHGLANSVLVYLNARVLVNQTLPAGGDSHTILGAPPTCVSTGDWLQFELIGGPGSSVEVTIKMEIVDAPTRVPPTQEEIEAAVQDLLEMTESLQA